MGNGGRGGTSLQHYMPLTNVIPLFSETYLDYSTEL
jgi:hypothetical protein